MLGAISCECLNRIMKDTPSQQITILIQANTNKEAQQVLNEIGLKCLSKAEIVSAGELFTSEIATNDHLTDEEYKIIKSDKRVAILRDSDSKQRCMAILDAVHDVEIGLRTLLVYMPEITGQYHALVRERKYTKKQYNAGEITKDLLDPIVGYLTLGEIIDLFGMDLSIKKANDKEASWREVENALASAKDFADFKQQMTEKLKQRFVWDVVSKEILQTPIVWRDIQNDLKKLERARNDAAHFHIIMNAEKEEYIKLVDKILKKLTLKTKIEKTSTIKLSEQLSSLSAQFAALSSMPSISSWAEVMRHQLSSVDFSALSDSAKAINELTKDNFRMFSIDFGLSNQIAQTAASSLSSNLEVLRIAVSSLQSNLDAISGIPNSMERFGGIASWSHSLPPSSMPDIPKSSNDGKSQNK